MFRKVVAKAGAGNTAVAVARLGAFEGAVFCTLNGKSCEGPVPKYGLYVV